MGLFNIFKKKKKDPLKERPTVSSMQVIHLPKSSKGTKFYQYEFEKDIVQELHPDNKRRVRVDPSKGPIIRARSAGNALKNGRKEHEKVLHAATLS